MQADDDTVVHVTQDEFDAAKRRALEELDITYGELARQARERDFQSHRAHLLWIAIGHNGRAK